MSGEELVIVLRPDPGQGIDAPLIEELARRNQRLPDFKRLSGYVVWEEDFPRTASMKIKRPVLAEAIRAKVEREGAVVETVKDICFTVVNPVAGHGRCGCEAAPAIEGLPEGGHPA